MPMSRSQLAIVGALSILGLFASVTCSPNRWISNSFGAFAIRDVTGDGYDDVVGWFDNFDKMKRTRLTVIDGRTGANHYSCMGNGEHLAALLGPRVVTAADSWFSKPLRYAPQISLHDLAAGRVLHTQSVAVSVTKLCTVGQSVIAEAGSATFSVDPSAGTIQPMPSAPTTCDNSAAIVDTSSLAIVAPQDWPPAVAVLRPSSARMLVFSDQVTLWAGLPTGTNAPWVARIQGSQMVWSARLGGDQQDATWPPQNATGTDTRWFVPYVDGTDARLVALDAITGAPLWDVVILSHRSDAIAWHVCSMASGSQLVGLAHRRDNDCDEFVLLDASTGKVAFRYKRS
jgi:hypothetical protein